MKEIKRISFTRLDNKDKIVSQKKIITYKIPFRNRLYLFRLKLELFGVRGLKLQDFKRLFFNNDKFSVITK